MGAEENTAEQVLCYSVQLAGAGNDTGGTKIHFCWDLQYSFLTQEDKARKKSWTEIWYPRIERLIILL